MVSFCRHGGVQEGRRDRVQGGGSKGMRGGGCIDVKVFNMCPKSCWERSNIRGKMLDQEREATAITHMR